MLLIGLRKARGGFLLDSASLRSSNELVDDCDSTRHDEQPRSDEGRSVERLSYLTCCSQGENQDEEAIDPRRRRRR